MLESEKHERRKRRENFILSLYSLTFSLPLSPLFLASFSHSSLYQIFSFIFSHLMFFVRIDSSRKSDILKAEEHKNYGYKFWKERKL